MEALGKIAGCPVGKYLMLTVCMSCSNICPGDDDDWSICPPVCPEWSLKPSFLLDALHELRFTDTAKTSTILANETIREDIPLYVTNSTRTSPQDNSTAAPRHVPLTQILLSWPWVARISVLGAGGLVIIVLATAIIFRKSSNVRTFLEDAYARWLATWSNIQVRATTPARSQSVPEEVVIEADPFKQSRFSMTRQNSLQHRRPRPLGGTASVRYQKSPTRDQPTPEHARAMTADTDQANTAGTDPAGDDWGDDGNRSVVPDVTRTNSVQLGIHPEQETCLSPVSSRHRHPTPIQHHGYIRMNSVPNDMPGLTRDREPVSTNLELGDNSLSHIYPFPATPDQVDSCLLRPDNRPKLHGCKSFQPREPDTTYKFQTEKGSFRDLPANIR